jgi:hypothetical protein
VAAVGVSCCADLERAEGSLPCIPLPTTFMVSSWEQKRQVKNKHKIDCKPKKSVGYLAGHDTVLCTLLHLARQKELSK